MGRIYGLVMKLLSCHDDRQPRDDHSLIPVMGNESNMVLASPEKNF
jgi:hypothetical protein